MSHPLYVWTERYRPTRLADCILPRALRRSCEQFIQDKEIPNLLLVGTAGVGKTALAKTLCEEIGAECLMINASEEGRIDVLRTTIRDFAGTVTMSDTAARKYVILDEADYMSPQMQPALRGFLEEFAHNCGFMLTANYANRILPAIQSRCLELRFDVPTAEEASFKRAILTRLETILLTESVACDKDTLKAVAKKFYPDIRQMITQLHGHVVERAISPGILAATTDILFEELVTLLKAKKFQSVRTWLGQHTDVLTSDFYSVLGQRLDGHLQGEAYANAIIVLADYQYRSSFSADTQLAAAACCAELMGLRFV